MITVKNVFLLFLLSLYLPTSVLSKEVNLEEIDPSLELIQVAALKKRKNILQIKEFFREQNFFVEYGDDFMRLYIVNIKKKHLKVILKMARQKYPSAFIATYKVKDILTTLPTEVVTEKEETPIENLLLIEDAASPEFLPQNTYDGALNRNTILKTRKKFF